MSLKQKWMRSLRRFVTERRGAFAISFAMMGAFFLAFAALGLEGSRYITERARLSDAMEQASLALTAEDNGVATAKDRARNSQLASDWLTAWMDHARSIGAPEIERFEGSIPNSYPLFYVEYRLNSHALQNSWFSSSFFPSFKKQVNVGGNGAARKFRSNIDVAFVIDFSGSMRRSIDPENTNGEHPWKLDVAKDIVVDISQQLAAYKIDNQVAFIPFGWGTRRGNYCSPQFVLREPLPESMFGEAKSLATLYDYIDYEATIKSIPNQVNDIVIPISEASNYLCLKFNEMTDYDPEAVPAETVELTSDPQDIKDKITHMLSGDWTLVSSGILEGVQKLVPGKASRKILVIVSDGEDNPILDRNGVRYGITEKLVQQGLCEKIREVLTTPQSVGKIAFIALQYAPTSDWKKCVGADNFYTASNYDEFKDAMNRAVFEEVGHNTLKN